MRRDRRHHAQDCACWGVLSVDLQMLPAEEGQCCTPAQENSNLHLVYLPQREALLEIVRLLAQGDIDLEIFANQSVYHLALQAMRASFAKGSGTKDCIDVLEISERFVVCCKSGSEEDEGWDVLQSSC